MPKKPELEDKDKLALALELLEKLLKDGTGENRRHCKHCGARMSLPIELHRKNCVLRRAWALVKEQTGPGH